MLFENFSHGFSLLDISQYEAVKYQKKKKKMFWLYSLIKSFIVKYET